MLSKEKIRKKIDKIDWDEVWFWTAVVAAGAWGVYVGHMIGWNIGWSNACGWSEKAVECYGVDAIKSFKDSSLTVKDLGKMLDDPELLRFVKYFKVVK